MIFPHWRKFSEGDIWTVEVTSIFFLGHFKEMWNGFGWVWLTLRLYCISWWYYFLVVIQSLIPYSRTNPKSAHLDPQNSKKRSNKRRGKQWKVSRINFLYIKNALILLKCLKCIKFSSSFICFFSKNFFVILKSSGICLQTC